MGFYLGEKWGERTMYALLDSGPVSFGPAARADLAPARRRNFVRRPEPPLLVDLGADMGTRRWWRGFATLCALCSATFLLAPQTTPLIGRVSRPLTGAALKAAQDQSITPLSMGARTGARRVGTPLVQPASNVPERASIEFVTTLSAGDRLDAALYRAGVSPSDAAQAARLAGNAVPLAELESGTALAVTLGPRPAPGMARPLQSLELRARFDLRLKLSRLQGQLVLERIPIRVESRPVRLTGRAGDSLYYALRSAGATFELAQAYLRALAPHVDFESDLSGGARFDLIVAHEKAAIGESRFGGLLYAGLQHDGRTLQLLDWTVDGVRGWYDARSVSVRRTGMVLPVQAARISSGFGFRFHPLLGYSRFHKGTDYAAVLGTPIYAVTDGIVAHAGWAGGYGNMVRLNHSGGLGTGYAHMSRIAVAPGQRVLQGQIIGYVGTTGLSTGPHLHFEIYRNGAAVSPASVLFESRALLSGPDLAAFQARLRAVLAMAPLNAQRPVAAALAPKKAPQ